jgi:hypothetical protein
MNFTLFLSHQYSTVAFYGLYRIVTIDFSLKVIGLYKLNFLASSFPIGPESFNSFKLYNFLCIL